MQRLRQGVLLLKPRTRALLPNDDCLAQISPCWPRGRSRGFHGCLVGPDYGRSLARRPKAPRKSSQGFRPIQVFARLALPVAQKRRVFLLQSLVRFCMHMSRELRLVLSHPDARLKQFVADLQVMQWLERGPPKPQENWDATSPQNSPGPSTNPLRGWRARALRATPD